MKNKKGFTVIEIVVATTIAAIIFLVVGSMLIGQWQIFRSESALYEIRSQNIIAQNIITKNIEESLNVVASSTINNENFTSDADTIILKLPSIDTGQNVIPGSFDYIAFDRDVLDSTKLISNTEKDPMSARPSGKKIIAQFVNSLNFRYNDSEWDNVNLVEVTLVTQKEVENVIRESKGFRAAKLKNK